VTKDIRSCKWMKLVVNAAELVPSAVLDLPLYDAVNPPGMLETIRAAGYEAMEAAGRYEWLANNLHDRA
jgi:2-dehydropantoate 2-reductase